MRALLILLVLFAAPVRGDDLDTLAAWMTGSFSSEKQSKAGPDYLDIRLEMVPIWTDRDDARWLCRTLVRWSEERGEPATAIFTAPLQDPDPG